MASGVAEEEKPSLPAEYTVPKVWAPKQPLAGFNRPFAGPWGEDRALKRGEHALQLHGLATPNGQKVSIFLEELSDLLPELEYDAWLIHIGEGDQFTSGFNAINPNSKIPAMLDYSDPAKPVRIFETGSILIYLAEKFDKEGLFLPKDYPLRAECLSWLMWQMGSAPFIGGGLGHFYHYAPLSIEYAIDRYAMETKRLLDVLDKQLAAGGPFVLGAQYTIADIAIFPWLGQVALGRLYGAAEFLDVEAYTHVQAWARRIDARPAVQRGRQVNSADMPERHSRKDFEA